MHLNATGQSGVMRAFGILPHILHIIPAWCRQISDVACSAQHAYRCGQIEVDLDGMDRPIWKVSVPRFGKLLYVMPDVRHGPTYQLDVYIGEAGLETQERS